MLCRFVSIMQGVIAGEFRALDDVGHGGRDWLALPAQSHTTDLFVGVGARHLILSHTQQFTWIRSSVSFKTWRYSVVVITWDSDNTFPRPRFDPW